MTSFPAPFATLDELELLHGEPPAHHFGDDEYPTMIGLFADGERPKPSGPPGLV